MRSLICPTIGENAYIPITWMLITNPITVKVTSTWAICTGVITITETIATCPIAIEMIAKSALGLVRR